MASSLEHLGTDYVDSFVLHGPSSRSHWTTDDFEIWQAMMKSADAGHTRLLGVSNISLSNCGRCPAHMRNHQRSSRTDATPARLGPRSSALLAANTTSSTRISCSRPTLKCCSSGHRRPRHQSKRHAGPIIFARPCRRHAATTGTSSADPHETGPGQPFPENADGAVNAIEAIAG